MCKTSGLARALRRRSVRVPPAPRRLRRQKRMVPLMEFPKRSCSVSKDRHLHLQQIGVLMEFCPGLAKQFRAAALAKARRELALGAMQPAEPGSFAEKPRERVKRVRDSPARL